MRGVVEKGRYRKEGGGVEQGVDGRGRYRKGWGGGGARGGRVWFRFSSSLHL